LFGRFQQQTDDGFSVGKTTAREVVRRTTARAFFIGWTPESLGSPALGRAPRPRDLDQARSRPPLRYYGQLKAAGPHFPGGNKGQLSIPVVSGLEETVLARPTDQSDFQSLVQKPSVFFFD
jgi:hypothetical protein